MRRRIDWKKTSPIVDSSSSSEESERGEVKADPEVTCEVGEAARGMTDQEVQASGGQIDQAGIRERLAELRQMERVAMQSIFIEIDSLTFSIWPQKYRSSVR